MKKQLKGPHAKSRDAAYPDCRGSGRKTVNDILGREKDFGGCPMCAGSGKVPYEDAE